MLDVLDICEHVVWHIRIKGSFNWCGLGGACIDLAQKDLIVLKFVCGSTVYSLL